MPPTYTELSNLEHLFRGDQSQIREWIGLYLQESPAYFDQLTAGLESGDAQAMATAAHDLQPQAHYLGSARMLELLMAIEEQAVANGTATCSDLLDALNAVRRVIEGELRAALDLGQANLENR